jgi:hypothetical protein
MSLKINIIKNEGDAQQEYVVMAVLSDCNLGNYALVDTTYAADRSVSNKWRHSFWFPSLQVQAEDYVYVYTRKGRYEVQPYATPGQKAVNLHLFFAGSDAAIWNDGGDKATLVQYAVISRGAAS